MAIKLMMGFCRLVCVKCPNRTVDCAYLLLLLLALFHGQTGGKTFDIHYWTCPDEDPL